MSIFGDISHTIRGAVRSGERAVGARDTQADQQAAAAARAEEERKAYYQSLTPEQMEQRAAEEGARSGPTYLQKWQASMPSSYNLGGNPDQANQYAAQALATGQQAAGNINQMAAQSQGVGYELGTQMAQTGQNYGEALAGQGMSAGAGLIGYGQQQAQGIQQLGQGAQDFGMRMSDALSGQGQQALGYGQGQAGQIGQYAGQLGQMGKGVFGQGAAVANRNIIGQQQSALQGIEAQEGPSAAQAQLRSGLNQAQASNLAMARSGRGWGGSAAAMSQAQGANAAAGQQAANSAAMLRAQENAAYRSRAAQNIAAAGQLGLGQAQTNDAQQRALYAAGLGGVQSAGQMQSAAAGIGQNAYSQQLAAQQAAAGAGQAGIDQRLSAQQAGAQLGASTMQAGGQMQLSGLESGGNMALRGQESGANTQLSGFGQAGQLYGQGGMMELGAQQQALGAQQQQVANNMAYQNQMLDLHQGNQQMQMNTQNNNAAAKENAKQRTLGYVGAGLNALGSAAGALSDRNAKKDIAPTNGLAFISPGGDIDSAEAAERMFGANPYTHNGQPLDRTQELAGLGGPGGYDFGTGISGPNQMQSAAASEGAAAGASAAAQGQLYDNKKKAAFGSVGKGLGSLGSDLMSQSTTFRPQAFRPMSFQPTPIPQPNMPALSDKNEKYGYALSDESAKEAIDDAPGYSYRYKDPGAMGADDGVQFGIMAQDLEKTPAGRSVVKKQPDGTRMVDTSRLTMVNTAALNALSREIEELRARAGKGKAA